LKKVVTCGMALHALVSALLCGGCSGTRPAQDVSGRGGEAGIIDERAFWEAFEIDGNWAEYWPTLRELALNADVAGRGTIESVRAGTSVQGDAPEDVVEEVVLRVRFEETWAGQLEGGLLDFTFVADPAKLQAAQVPRGPVVVFARSRRDRPGQFRLVNGYGLWAGTVRGNVDTPATPDSADQSPYAAEIAEFDSLEDFSRHIAKIFNSR